MAFSCCLRCCHCVSSPFLKEHSGCSIDGTFLHCGQSPAPVTRGTRFWASLFRQALQKPGEVCIILTLTWFNLRFFQLGEHLWLAMEYFLWSRCYFVPALMNVDDVSSCLFELLLRLKISDSMTSLEWSTIRIVRIFRLISINYSYILCFAVR